MIVMHGGDCAILNTELRHCDLVWGECSACMQHCNADCVLLTLLHILWSFNKAGIVENRHMILVMTGNPLLTYSSATHSFVNTQDGIGEISIHTDSTDLKKLFELRFAKCFTEQYDNIRQLSTWSLHLTASVSHSSNQRSSS